MPGQTPNRSIPYPVGTDPINAYPALAQTAAQNLDTHTHDRNTVSSAQYADNAGAVNGQAFRRTDAGTDPAYVWGTNDQNPNDNVLVSSARFARVHTVVVAPGSSGDPGDTGIRIRGVAINGDVAANSRAMDFVVRSSDAALLARWLLTGPDFLTDLVPVGITNATIRVNYVA